MLKSGIGWELLPHEMGCGSGMTCWRRLRDWQQGGVWERLHHELLQRLAHADKLAWSRASLDSASVAAKRGGEATGPNPTDRGKPGTKRHVVVDAGAIPLAVILSAANVHDALVLETTVDAIGCHSADPAAAWATGATASASGQAACRQRLRLSSVPGGRSPTQYRSAYRTPGHRVA